MIERNIEMTASEANVSRATTLRPEGPSLWDSDLILRETECRRADRALTGSGRTPRGFGTLRKQKQDAVLIGSDVPVPSGPAQNNFRFALDTASDWPYSRMSSRVVR